MNHSHSRFQRHGPAHSSHSAASPFNPSANTKIPPAWDPARNADYSFADWKRDLRNWVLVTELTVAQQCPAVIFQLGELAKEVGYEIPEGGRINGMVLDFGDGQGRVHRSGLDILLHMLTIRFDALALDTQMKAIDDYKNFRRRAGEHIDMAFTRWELLKGKANARGQFNMSVPAEADHLLKALHISPEGIMKLCTPFGDIYPQTADQLRSMTTSIRRIGHMYERTRGVHAATSSSFLQRAHAAFPPDPNDMTGSFFLPVIDDSETAGVFTRQCLAHQARLHWDRRPRKPACTRQIIQYLHLRHCLFHLLMTHEVLVQQSIVSLATKRTQLI